VHLVSIRQSYLLEYSVVTRPSEAALRVLSVRLSLRLSVKYRSGL